MLVQEVDAIGLEPSERCHGHLADVLRPAVGAGDSLSFEAKAELAGDHDLVAPAFERAAQQLFVGQGAVHLRGIEEGDAELDGAVDGGYGFSVIGHAVGLAHPHAAEPEGRYLESLASELAGWEHAASFRRNHRTGAKACPFRCYSKLLIRTLPNCEEPCTGSRNLRPEQAWMAARRCIFRGSEAARDLLSDPGRPDRPSLPPTTRSQFTARTLARESSS
jgi:hypothetical protein